MMSHNVLRVYHDVLLVVHNVLHVSICFMIYQYHNVLQVFHNVLLCLTMFSESRNDRHR